MADPVSLALAIAGLAAPVFKFSIAAIHFILDIKDVPDDQEYLVLSFRLREQRLYTWGEHDGLVVYKGNRKSRDDEEEDGGDENALMEARTKSIVFGAHRGLVLDLLVQISVLFDDFRKHQIPHKRLRKVEGFEGILELATINEDLFLDRKRSFLKEALKSFRSTTAGVRRRARWASFDMKEFEELIRRFSSLNDSITALLDSKLQKDIDNTTQDIYREVLQMATKQEQFKEIIEATKFGQRVQGSQEKDLKMLMELASFKAFYSDVDNQENAGLLDYVSLEIVRPFKMTASIDQIKLEDVADEAERFTTYHGSRLKGWYSSTPNPSEESQEVWIEWKMYPSCDGVYLTEYFQIAQQRDFELASTLVQLLNVEDKREQFRVPYCLGYFDGRQYTRRCPSPVDAYGNYDKTVPEKFGFVYAMPKGAAPGTRPRSLRQLLGDPDCAKPDITDCIALAQALASSLLFLHTVDWFGKYLRSDNVLFFVENGNHNIDFANPIHPDGTISRDYPQSADFIIPCRKELSLKLSCTNIQILGTMIHPKRTFIRLTGRATISIHWALYLLSLRSGCLSKMCFEAGPRLLQKRTSL